jgi:frataxin-like iron-binding protein CyaY
MTEHKWERFGDKYYYYDTDTGKIVGSVSKIALQEIWIALVYTGEYTFTLQDEKHLGQYINLEFAKRAAEFFWERESRTLLE